VFKAPCCDGEEAMGMQTSARPVIELGALGFPALGGPYQALFLALRFAGVHTGLGPEAGHGAFANQHSRRNRVIMWLVGRE
jgi:hypothetical protein